MLKPICPYCGNEAHLVKGEMVYASPAFADLNVWQCAPCDAYVGCHNKGKFHDNDITPKGTLANKELRRTRQLAHEAFDGAWKNLDFDAEARTAAYAWLAEQMGLPPEKCHIGTFDIEQCIQVIKISPKYTTVQLTARALKP